MPVLPSSRTALRARSSLVDAAWAIFAPILALHLRDAPALSYSGFVPTLLYCSISVAISLTAFSALRVQAGITRYFSVVDAVSVAKAVAAATFATYAVVFSLTRLDGIPRTTPIVHALILLTGLLGTRILSRLLHAKRTSLPRHRDAAGKHILMIGSNRLSLSYIELIRAYSPGLYSIIAVLDDRPEMLGRTLAGVPVIGLINQLRAIVNEFAEHGVRVGHVIVGRDPDRISEDSLRELREVCSAHEIKLDFVPELMGLHALGSTQDQFEVESEEIQSTLPAYFTYKRYFDILISISAIFLLSPLWLLIVAVAVLDAGLPVFFWQQRLGEGGRPFLLYKIRTLRPPYDGHGRNIMDAERLSRIGHLFRRCRLDEFPQLLNVLVGDMSLIGPRPLLRHDQPPDPSIRLSVPPGITGWAQVNGGKLLSVGEKTALDEWYVRNASLWLDLRIICLTLPYVFKGESRSEAAIAEARGICGQPWGALDEARVVPVRVAVKLAGSRTSPV